MKKRIKDFVHLARLYPILSTLVVSSSVMTVSYVLNHSLGISGVYFIITFIMACLSLILATAASNILNQITDLDEDKIAKPYRPIPSGKFTTKEAGIICLSFYLVSFFLSVAINLYFSLFTTLFILFTITYSVYPRVKRFLILNQLWIGIARGFFLILASWSVFSYPFQKIPMSLGLISCIFVFGGMSSKDIFDANADKQVGVKTLVNAIGAEKTALFSLICMAGSFILIIPLILLNVFNLLYLPLILFVIPSFYIFLRMHNIKKYSRFENVSAWVLMHATNFIFVLCFAILTVIGENYL